MMNPVESDIFPFVTLMNDYKSKRQLHLVTESVWQRAILNLVQSEMCIPDYMSAMWFAHDCRLNHPG